MATPSVFSANLPLQYDHRLGHRDAMVTATIYAHVDTEQSVSASETFAKAMRGN